MLRTRTRMGTPGSRFRSAVKENSPLQTVGTVNAYSALIAEKCGAKSIYLSGSGVATASYGLPDLGITNLTDVCTDVTRITATTDLPLLVDVDTGFGGAFGITRCVNDLIRCGAAGFHIEDQVAEKRCGHRPGKQIVPVEEMVDRVSTAVAARNANPIDPEFVIMARCDSLSSEGLDSAIDRMVLYVKAGADMLFPEAFSTLDQYQELRNRLDSEGFENVAILANITEFGKTELFTPEKLADAGVNIVLHPLSAHRSMAKAAEQTYRAILNTGTSFFSFYFVVEPVIDSMQTRDELYHYLDYRIVFFLLSRYL